MFSAPFQLSLRVGYYMSCRAKVCENILLVVIIVVLGNSFGYRKKKEIIHIPKSTWSKDTVHVGCFVRALRALLGFMDLDWTLHTQPTAQDTIVGSWSCWLLPQWGSAQLCLASHRPWGVRPTCSPNSQPSFLWKCPIPRAGAAPWPAVLFWESLKSFGAPWHFSLFLPFCYKLFSNQLTSP